MIWTQRGWCNPTYELRDGDRLIGEQKRSGALRARALLHLRDRTVEFRQPKWWSSSYQAFDADTQEAIADYDGCSWRSSGTISVAGRTYRFVRSFWKSSARLEDERACVLFSIKSMDWFGRRYEVTLAEGTQFDDLMELLVHFTWFIMSTAQADSSAATVMAATAT